jgi:hypothetical protein
MVQQRGLRRHGEAACRQVVRRLFGGDPVGAGVREHPLQRPTDLQRPSRDLALRPPQHLAADEVDGATGVGDEVGRVDDPAPGQHECGIGIGELVVGRTGDDRAR